MSEAIDVKQVYQKYSFSQFGEDAILSWLLGGRRDGFYIDVGCHHPFRFSNTAALHLDLGWRGINIDIAEDSIRLFQHFRPKDTSLCLGVAGAHGWADATFFEEGAHNTISADAAFEQRLAPTIRERRRLEVFPLRDLLAAHLPATHQIDFLNVDAEGMDLEILRSNDWDRFRPGIVAVETHDLDLAVCGANDTYCFMRDVGYRLVSHAAVTSFYVQV